MPRMPRKRPIVWVVVREGEDGPYTYEILSVHMSSKGAAKEKLRLDAGHTWLDADGNGSDAEAEDWCSCRNCNPQVCHRVVETELMP